MVKKALWHFSWLLGVVVAVVLLLPSNTLADKVQVDGGGGDVEAKQCTFEAKNYETSKFYETTKDAANALLSSDENGSMRLSCYEAGWCTVIKAQGSATRHGTMYKFDCQSAINAAGKDDNTDTTDPNTCEGGAYDQCTSEDQCTAAGGEWKDDKCSAPSASSDGVMCQVGGGAGVIFCPIITLMAGLSDNFYNMISGFLELPASIFSTSGTAFKVYQNFLPLANILLAIAFIVIIYSTATGNGFGALSAYSVKKMLPRLIIFAILVNVSWWLCAMAVDISNIIGANIKGMFEGVADSAITDMGQLQTNFTGLSNEVLSGVGVGELAAVAMGAVFFKQLGPLLMLLLVVILVLFMVFVILVIRQAAVILLCVIAPLAIACGLLPNTQKLFQKWWNMFEGMLIVFPVVAVIYGGSALAATAIQRTADDADWMLQFTAAAVRVIPLFATPFVILGCLKALGSVGAAVGGFALGRATAGRKWASNKARDNYQHSMAHRGIVRARSAAAGAGLAAAQKVSGGRLKGPDSWRQAASESGKIKEERASDRIKARQAYLNNNPGMTMQTQQEIAETGYYTVGEGDSAKRVKVDNYTRAAAINNTAKTMSGEQMDNAVRSVAAERSNMSTRDANSNGFNQVMLSAAKAAKDNGKGSLNEPDVVRALDGSMSVNTGSRNDSTVNGGGIDATQFVEAQVRFLSSRSEEDLSKVNKGQIDGWAKSLERSYELVDAQNTNPLSNTPSTHDRARREVIDALKDSAGSYVQRESAGLAPRLDPKAHQAMVELAEGTYDWH